MPDELEAGFRGASRVAGLRGASREMSSGGDSRAESCTDLLFGYVLVSRRGCHLCEDAEEALRAASLPFDWRDVDADPHLRDYTFRVPVLLYEGKVVLEGPITQDKLVRALNRIEEC
ncbi:MAG TPA: glutaredoxin family protein [Meiothermus sp.]|nr:glutaredoxin family protein [Meiothermus sp.]